VHGRFDSPWVATLLAGVSATLTCFVPFHMLLVMNGTGVVVMYVLLCLGAIAGRITGASAHAAWRMPFFPVAPAFALVALVYVIWANWGDPAVGRPSLIFNLVLLALATGYFLLLRRRRGGILSMTEAAEA
jgi:amino acid transporter